MNTEPTIIEAAERELREEIDKLSMDKLTKNRAFEKFLKKFPEEVEKILGLGLSSASEFRQRVEEIL